MITVPALFNVVPLSVLVLSPLTVSKPPLAMFVLPAPAIVPLLNVNVPPDPTVNVAPG